MHHLSLIDWLALGYSVFVIVCVIRLWPWGR